MSFINSGQIPGIISSNTSFTPSLSHIPFWDDIYTYVGASNSASCISDVLFIFCTSFMFFRLHFLSFLLTRLEIQTLSSAVSGLLLNSSNDALFLILPLSILVFPFGVPLLSPSLGCSFLFVHVCLTFPTQSFNRFAP